MLYNQSYRVQYKRLVLNLEQFNMSNEQFYIVATIQLLDFRRVF